MGRFLGYFDNCDFVETISRNLVPEADTEDFYRFLMVTDVLCDFEMVFTLAVPSGTNYDLYVYKWNGPNWSQLGSSTNAGTASELVTCGGCNIVCGGCGCTGCSSGGDYGVRVLRSGGVPTVCEDYTLTLEDL